MFKWSAQVVQTVNWEVEILNVTTHPVYTGSFWIHNHEYIASSQGLGINYFAYATTTGRPGLINL